ncbi:metallophosphoesterase family protein [Cardiobacteriaceae bacterium TAE3-ERU3]|nr:metallophosphoesterase family protein [Cardiobacteriaceae bacterium TAE3-ERU3]
MKIAIHSDLHTEVSLCTLDGLDEADLLVLAGDIGDKYTLPIFLERMRRDAPDLPTLYVMGNHEFYHHEYFEAKETYRDICAAYDVRMLDNEAVLFNDVLIAGTVLWSDFCLAGDQAASMAWAQRVLPDFKYIAYRDAIFTADDMLAEHQVAVQFLQETLQREAAHKLVISHFLPSRKVVAPKHAKIADDLIRSAYWTSDLPDLYHLADTWIYGHSHENVLTSDKGCRFISNQRGYSRKMNGHEKNGYQRNFIFNLES